MRHDDGHPLRPIRLPPPSPRERDAARLAAATGDVGAGAATGVVAQAPAALMGPAIEDGAWAAAAPGFDAGPAGASFPPGSAWSGMVARARDGRPRFLMPEPSADPPAEPLRAQAMRAPAWVELRESAWLITRESGSIVHASDLVYAVLGRTPAELDALLGDPGDSSPGYSWIRRTVIAHGHAGVVLQLPQDDGGVRHVEVVSRRLPRRPGAEDRYFSVLTLREG